MVDYICMDSFTNKNSRNNRRPKSVDGVSFGFGGDNRGSIDFKRPQTKLPRREPAQLPRILDDFRRPQGLSAPQNSTVLSATPKPVDFKPVPRQATQLDGVSRARKKSGKKRRLKLAAFSCLAVILLSAFGYGYLKNIFGGGGGAAALQENVDPSKLRGEGDGRVNILLMGRGGEGAEAPDLTDTIMLVSIDPINNEAGLVSIPRDLYVTVPGTGAMKINEVFYTGKQQILGNAAQINGDVKKQADEKGYDLAKQTVEKVLGVPIHYRGMIDFKGFEEAIDTVGGIDVNVTKAVHENMRFNGQPYTLNVKPGQKHFDGFEALAYARSRYSSSGGDFDRSERQRLMVIALKEKILSAGTYTNPAKVTGLLDNFGSHVQTDFGLSDLTRLQDIFNKVDSNKIDSLSLVDKPNDFLATTNIGGLSVVTPKAGAENYGAIHKYIRNKLRDGYLKSENANVMVLNGTQRDGLATQKADELKSYGYNVGTVDNAPVGQDYANTMIIDLRNGQKKYTKRYLEQRFGTVAGGNLPHSSIQSGQADFVIILGNDTRYGN